MLGACSSFLRDTFLSLPLGLPHFTLIVPGVDKAVVDTLIDFLYTGEMKLERGHTHHLQELVNALQIDPENVRVETSDKERAARLVQSKITTMIGPKSKMLANKKLGGPLGTDGAGNDEGGKTLPERAAKRRASSEPRKEDGVKNEKDLKGKLLTSLESAQMQVR